MYCVMSKSVWFADMIKSDFIHSQNFSAVEITSEEDSCKENVSEGDFFFLFGYCKINLCQTTVRVKTTYKCCFSPDVLRYEEKKAAVRTRQVSDDQPGATDEKRLLVSFFFKYYLPLSVCFKV